MLSADSVFFSFNSLTLACQRPTTKAQVLSARFLAPQVEKPGPMSAPAAVRRLQHRGGFNTWAFVVGLWQASVKELKLKKHGIRRKASFAVDSISCGR